MASDRDDDTQEIVIPQREHLVLGYDVGDHASFSAVVVMKKRADGTVEVIDTATMCPPGKKLTRALLLFYACTVIKAYRPASFSIAANGGPPLMVSAQTVREIAEGTKTWRDLLIGQDGTIENRGE